MNVGDVKLKRNKRLMHNYLIVWLRTRQTTKERPKLKFHAKLWQIELNSRRYDWPINEKKTTDDKQMTKEFPEFLFLGRRVHNEREIEYLLTQCFSVGWLRAQGEL